MSEHADTIRRAIYANGPQEWDVPLAALDALLAERQQAIEALRNAEVFYPEAVALIRELVVDAEGIYEPEKGWPTHIEKAHHLGDHDETIAEIRAALAKLGEQPK